jgi:outer membrane biogenesis lipoprotein LolB
MAPVAARAAESSGIDGRRTVPSRSFIVLIAAAILVACTSAQTPENAAPEAKPVWTAATEADTAAVLDQKFRDAAKGYVQLKKDGVLMFCKKQREIGSNIRTLQCITEAQLRNQVETMDDYRQRRRDAAKCTHGPGCSAGF